MPKNNSSINDSLFDLLKGKGYSPTMLSTAGKEIPTPDEAEVFQFNFVKDGEDYGKVTLSIDDASNLIVYYSDDVADSEKGNGSTYDWDDFIDKIKDFKKSKKTSKLKEDDDEDSKSEGGEISWYSLLNQLKRFAQRYQLSFELKNTDKLKSDMAKREHMKKQDRIAESKEEKDPIWNKGTPMPKDYTCHCGIHVHPSVRNPKAIHTPDCPYAKKKGVAEQAVTETAEELQELTQFSKGMANFLAKSYAQYIKNPQTAKYVQQQISQPITDGAPYRALSPTIGIVSVPGADTYTSPGLELAKKFVNMVVAYFPAPGDADYYGFSEAAPAVYDARTRTVVINKDYLSDPTDLASTIAHEVQHSIDDLKSRKGLSVKTDQLDLELSYYDQGKAFKQKQSAGATNNAQKYQSYLSMPHEVNARFTEVINDIKQRIEKEDIQNIGSAGLSELARSAFNQHYMHEVFPNGAKDPGYKRLLSRVYAWLSKYYNDRIYRNGSFNPQPATPVLEEQGVAEDKGRTMSRAAKGIEKYGKEGMQALAKAGREGKDLDKIRNKYNKYDEGAKVDRMVNHIEKSEEKAGKSKKEAENIAWATANKRGMLNNRNKK
jgi:hypothetical protein